MDESQFTELAIEVFRFAEELGDALGLGKFFPRGSHLTRAIAPEVILHVIAGNTPTAGLQSLTRGLLLGSLNLLKRPSNGLPDMTNFDDVYRLSWIR